MSPSRRRYGLLRGVLWLCPPAAVIAARHGRVVQPRVTEDPREAWSVALDDAIERQQVLRQAWGIITTIRAIPNE
jgi:hypothetical protein